ncbi:MAG: hypothetical protein ACI4TW_00700, partial [Prevotella sp.]
MFGKADKSCGNNCPFPPAHFMNGRAEYWLFIFYYSFFISVSILLPVAEVSFCGVAERECQPMLLFRIDIFLIFGRESIEYPCIWLLERIFLPLPEIGCIRQI